MKTADIENYNEEINNAFSHYETNVKLPTVIIVSLFVLGILCMFYKFHLTSGLSTVDFLFENPEHQFLITTLDFVYLILVLGSMFAYIIVFGLSEKNKYYKIAKQNCLKYLSETKEKINQEDLSKKIDEELTWVRKNI